MYNEQLEGNLYLEKTTFNYVHSSLLSKLAQICQSSDGYVQSKIGIEKSYIQLSLGLSLIHIRDHRNNI